MKPELDLPNKYTSNIATSRSKHTHNTSMTNLDVDVLNIKLKKSNQKKKQKLKPIETIIEGTKYETQPLNDAQVKVKSMFARNEIARMKNELANPVGEAKNRKAFYQQQNARNAQF